LGNFLALRHAKQPAARQRPQLIAEIVGGEISW